MRRALLFNDTNTEFLFMTHTPDGFWHVDITMWECWRSTPEPINIYATDPATDTFVSIHPMGLINHWIRLSDTEIPHVRSIVEQPWIPAHVIYTTIPPDEIFDFDMWTRGSAIATAAPPHWEAAVRPHLATMAVHRSLPDPILLEPMADIAPLQITTIPISVLPPHVASIVIAAAAATGATCPITLDRIDPADAVVTACGHVFTASALRHWRRDHCPECRQPLSVLR